jgi:hypothetical protein
MVKGLRKTFENCSQSARQTITGHSHHPRQWRCAALDHPAQKKDSGIVLVVLS